MGKNTGRLGKEGKEKKESVCGEGSTWKSQAPTTDIAQLRHHHPITFKAITAFSLKSIDNNITAYTLSLKTMVSQPGGILPKLDNGAF